MATFLDVLADLLGEPEARAGYRSDPVSWLRAEGLGYLCGEDVVAGLPVLRDWIPDLGDRADALAAFAAAAAPGESELEAAVRTIDALLLLVEPADAGGAAAAAADVT